tara:strand:+ start:354 stop:668 length:315 start_codon:yes stop_codon:yes gene_type:complete
MLKLIFTVGTTLAVTALTWRRRKLIRAILEDLLDKGMELTAKPKFWHSKSEDASGVSVAYITGSGSKYHQSGCRFLNGEAKVISLEKAIEEYTPCGYCQPDLHA